MIFFLQKNINYLVATLLFVAILNVAGQDEHHAAEAQHQETHHLKHQVAAGFGLTFNPMAGELENTEASGLFIPTIGLDYFFHVHHKWEIGFMADYELDHYVIVEHEIEREKSLLLTLAGIYKITDHWGLLAGGGIELENHEHLAILRFGTEYSIDLKKNWVILPKFVFDFKEIHSTWAFSVSLGKKF